MPNYKPANGYIKHGDGWQTPRDGTYRRPDGSTFQVPLKVTRGPLGTLRTYGGYTQAELHQFSEAAKNNKK